MKTPPSPSNVPPLPPSTVNPWSTSLQNLTREAVDEYRGNPITGKLHLKNTNSKYGHITLLDLLAGRLIVHCENTGECFTVESVDDLLAAGWAID